MKDAMVETQKQHPSTDPPRVGDFAPYLQTLLGPTADLVEVQTQTLAGGLMAGFVLQLRVRYSEAGGAPQTRSLVVKRLDAATSREGKIYQMLAATMARSFMPALAGIEPKSSDETHLYIEAVEAISSWPWSSLEDAARVLDQLAILHRRAACGLEDLVRDWDYESDLEEQATETLAMLERTSVHRRDRILGASLPAARRLVRNLRRWRRELVEDGRLPSCVIHGDVHPGNVLIRAHDRNPILLDWARARVGSPLEDVSSWLQWLGFWEPTVKSKHDTLLARYLTARGLGRLPSRSLRAVYWLAGASNCFAGALRYHLSVLEDVCSGEDQRAAAQRAAHDCLRVIRRADAYDREAHGAERRRSNSTSCGP